MTRLGTSGYIGLVIVLSVIFAAIFAPWVVPYHPLDQNLQERLKAPSLKHLAGTDAYGRDVFSRILWGGRISLTVGLFSILIGVGVGSMLGLISGYFGRWIDMIIMRFMDLLLSLPPLLLALAIVAALGSSLINVVMAISISVIPVFGRITRGLTLSLKEFAFVESARAVGAKHSRIMLRYILPNAMSTIIVMATLNLGTAILTESSLSFLGLGVRPPSPTWGNIIASGRGYLGIAPFVTVFSGLAIMITVFGFNMLGEALRDTFDVRLLKGFGPN